MEIIAKSLTEFDVENLRLDTSRKLKVQIRIILREIMRMKTESERTSRITASKACFAELYALDLNPHKKIKMMKSEGRRITGNEA
jgi:hypothetical protein